MTHSEAIVVRSLQLQGKDVSAALLAEAIAVIQAAMVKPAKSRKELRPQEDWNLSPQQQQVLTLRAQGHAPKAIAEMLNMSVKTVGTHIGRCIERMGANGTDDALYYWRTRTAA
jgi:DNA-binding NarL/FixJ family response regulator